MALLPPRRRLAGCYPHRRLFVIIDGLDQVHDHPRFLALCKKLRITLVFTPRSSPRPGGPG
ncbi:MAG: hypothetical protein ACRDF0_07955 [Candidatus Limnocylindria bacterium]